MYSRYVGLPHPKKIPITFWPNIVIGLTEDHVNLTTYFEGEIIGWKYTFLTQHPDWGSTGAIDLQHWAQFSAFGPLQKSVGRGNLAQPSSLRKYLHAMGGTVRSPRSSASDTR